MVLRDGVLRMAVVWKWWLCEDGGCVEVVVV